MPDPKGLVCFVIQFLLSQSIIARGNKDNSKVLLYYFNVYILQNKFKFVDRTSIVKDLDLKFSLNLQTVSSSPSTQKVCSEQFFLQSLFSIGYHNYINSTYKWIQFSCLRRPGSLFIAAILHRKSFINRLYNGGLRLQPYLLPISMYNLC